MSIKYIGEIWKWVIGYKHYYKVSNYGRVLSVARLIETSDGRICSYKERYLSLQINGTGYPVVKLCKDGKCKTFDVHRLVLETFVGPCPENMECRHLDGNRQNNKWPENICWGTSKENRQDTIRNGNLNPPKGEDCYNSKLNKNQIIKIREYYRQGAYTQTQLAAMFNVSNQLISQIISYKVWASIPNKIQEKVGLELLL